MSAAPQLPAPVRLRLRITAAAETAVRYGHPWVFSDSVLEANRPGASGEFAIIYDRKDKFLAIGLFDPNSPIRVRILHTGKPVTLDADWWATRLEQALARRRNLFDSETTGYRLIHGESDGWPGLVLDRYDTTLVLKLYTAAWLPELPKILALLQAIRTTVSSPSPPLINGGEGRGEVALSSVVSEAASGYTRLILRLSRNIQPVAGKAFKLHDGQVMSGATPEGPVIFAENGVHFEADVLRGQKTGFFLDQRENRREVELLAQGRRVLNTFSFSGGFSVYAARGGAKSVTDLDISAHALDSAKRNFALNQNHPAVAACRHETVQADAFEWIATGSDKFDLIVLDPPSLAKRAAEREGAIRAYERVNGQGIHKLSPHGILVAGSCSAHVPATDFFDAVRRAALKSGRPFTELKTVLHPPDHPAGFKEAEYLKVIYLKFNG